MDGIDLRTMKKRKKKSVIEFMDEQSLSCTPNGRSNSRGHSHKNAKRQGNCYSTLWCVGKNSKAWTISFIYEFDLYGSYIFPLSLIRRYHLTGVTRAVSDGLRWRTAATGNRSSVCPSRYEICM